MLTFEIDQKIMEEAMLIIEVEWKLLEVEFEIALLLKEGAESIGDVEMMIMAAELYF